MTTTVEKNAIPAPPKGQKTLGRESLWDKFSFLLYVFLAFFIPFILIFVAFRIAGVEPYGTNQILVTDLWHQYYPFLVDYQNKLQNGGSLLWTWHSGGGTNYLALMAYYLASPLNFFSVLVPPEKLKVFLYVITCVKIGLAGMFFSLFLRITFKRKDASITAFGIMYALCAFIMGYYWNVIWLDTVALLPLVIAGTFALLKNGKVALYIAALALSILANYYIGLFTCVFVLLVSIGYCFVEFKGLKNLLWNFVKMAVCSLTAIMISAILTVPAYFALGHTYSSENSFPEQFAVNIGKTADFGGVLEAIGRTISNSVAFIQPTSKEGLPNIYSGVFVIFLAILFLFCSKIKKRERIFCGGLLLFFMLSFAIRQLDFVWHGFHFPNMLPYRFSFLYTFVVIYMAFRVFMNIDAIKPVSAIAAIFGFVIYMGIATKYLDLTGNNNRLTEILKSEAADGSAVDPVLLSSFLGFVFAAWILLYALRNTLPRIGLSIGAGVIGILAIVLVAVSQLEINMSGVSTGEAIDGNALTSGGLKALMIVLIVMITVLMAVLLGAGINSGNRIFKVLLSAILLMFALLEGTFSAVTGVRTVGVTDATTYPLGTENTLACVNVINELEKDNIDLAHAEVNKYHTLNDDALIGINGLSMFNSMGNQKITDYMEKFGLCGWVASNRYTYQESAPFTNMMLNVKYLIAPYGAYLDTAHNESIYESGSARLMRNRYYINQGFMVDDALLDYDVETLAISPIDNQNQFFRLATGIDGAIYEDLEVSDFEAPEGEAISGSNGTYTYSADGTYGLKYTVPRDGIAVAYFDTFYTENVSVQINGAERISYYIKRPFIMMVGDVKAGDVITLSCGISGGSSGTITSRCAMVNEELYQQAYEKFSASTLNASKVTDTEISGNINAAEDGLFYTSISYVEGWKAYVDGEEVQITPVGNAMLAFKLTKGPHIIDIKYTPEGFTAGLLLCIVGLVFYVLLILVSWKKEKIMTFVRSKLPEKKPAAPAAEPTEAAAADDGEEITVMLPQTEAAEEAADPDEVAEDLQLPDNEPSEDKSAEEENVTVQLGNFGTEEQDSDPDEEKTVIADDPDEEETKED